MSLVRVAALVVVAFLIAAVAAMAADPLPPDTTYRPLPTLPFSAVKANDEAQKPKVMHATSPAASPPSGDRSR